MKGSTDKACSTMVISFAAISSATLAALVLCGAFISGQIAVGLLLIAGIIVGAGNGVAARRLYATGLPFGLTSVLRLTVMSALMLGGTWLLGIGHIWPLILGLGLAQLALAGSAAFVAVRA